jgi:hypothetical protein
MVEARLDITGGNEGLIKALEESKAAVSEAFAQMKESAMGVKDAFEGIQKAALAFTAILAGGAAFKETVDASINAAKGAMELSRALGITATQASILKVAMDENFVSQDAVLAASNKIATTLKKNEQAFTNLGIATRDSNGNFRNSFDIMTDVNAKLAEFKEGSDRNVEGQKIYGRGWAEIAPTIRLTGEAMAEAKAKADALGLTVGVEGIAQAQEYRKAMAGVSTVFEALKKVVGDALVPALTALGEWFEDIGPQAVAAMRASLYAVYAAFSYLKEGVTIATDLIAGKVAVMGAQITRVMNTASKALSGDFSGAKAAWAEGTADIEAKSKFMSQQIIDDMKAATESRDKFMESQDKKQTPTADKTGAASSGNDSEKGKSRVSDWETTLKEKEAAFQEDAAKEGQLREFSKQQEIDYWKNILATTTTSLEERKAIRAKIASDELDIDKKSLEGSLATLKNEEAAAGKNLEARLAAEEKYTAAVGQIYGKDSKAYADSQKSILETKRSIIEQQRQLDDIREQAETANRLRSIANEETMAKERYDMGAISIKQLVALEQQYEAERYSIAVEGLTKRLALIDPTTDPVLYEQRMKQIEQAANIHEETMLKISTKANQQEMALAKTLQNQLTNGFAQAFKGIISGTETVGQAFRNIFSGILNTVITTLAQMAAAQLTHYLISLAQNRQEASSNAAVAATGGAKSAASIPYVGWLLAIGAAAAIFAAASGYKAEGGFDVPAGMSPNTQLHPKEMVLPAPLAERVRNMTGGEDGPGGGSRRGGGNGINVSVNAMDSRSVERGLKKNGPLQKVLRDMHRRGQR